MSRDVKKGAAIPPLLASPRHRRGLLGALLALFTACGAPSPPTPPTVAIDGVGPTIEPASVAPAASARPPVSARVTALTWETREPDARDRARRENRPLLIFFWAAWSSASLRMERELWTDHRVIALASRFVTLRIDATDAESANAEAYAQTYGVRSIPEIVLADAGGKRVAAVIGDPGTEPVITALRAALGDE